MKLLLIMLAVVFGALTAQAENVMVCKAFTLNGNGEVIDESPLKEFNYQDELKFSFKGTEFEILTLGTEDDIQLIMLNITSADGVFASATYPFDSKFATLYSSSINFNCSKK